MLIVLEGCDGTGKTTLANQLANLLDAEIIHCTKETPNTYTFFHGIIEASKTRNIIADRFMYGQFVYQKEEDRPLNEKARYNLEVELLAANGSVVFVTAPEDEVRKRLSSRGEELINGLTVKEVLDKFEELANSSLLNVVKYDTGKNACLGSALQDNHICRHTLSEKKLNKTVSGSENEDCFGTYNLKSAACAECNDSQNCVEETYSDDDEEEL